MGDQGPVGDQGPQGSEGYFYEFYQLFDGTYNEDYVSFNTNGILYDTTIVKTDNFTFHVNADGLYLFDLETGLQEKHELILQFELNGSLISKTLRKRFASVSHSMMSCKFLLALNIDDNFKFKLIESQGDITDPDIKYNKVDTSTIVTYLIINKVL